jgi:hypothetical protein
MKYLRQEAHHWVSMAVLAGGLISAVILFWLVKFEADISISITSF